MSHSIADDGNAAPAPGDGATPPPLPRPLWGAPRPVLALSAAQHEDLAVKVEQVLRDLLVTDNYDSLSNFIRLRDAFEKSKESPGNLKEFLARYRPPIKDKRHTCVGLGIELIRRLRDLEVKFPGLRSAMHLVSCQESIEDVLEYVLDASGPEEFWDEVEKEHVMVCVQIRVDGRAGLLLADPGYHVARAVTVMQDREYPHTGWFIQSEDPRCRKEYCYEPCAAHSSYVEWRERETRGDKVKTQTSLVYITKPYLSAVSVTEKRNLVYNFRSLLARNQKGKVTAGVYFPVVPENAHFTIFNDNSQGNQRIKIKFSIFSETGEIPDNVIEQISICNDQLHFNDGELLQLLRRTAAIMADSDYIKQVLDINEAIREMAE